MEVPEVVRQAAVAAFATRRPERRMLALLHDTFTDSPPTAASPVTAAHRSLLFGLDDTTVRVDIRYLPLLTLLTLFVHPPQVLEVEVISPDPLVRLVVRGVSPLDVATDFSGPASLLVSGTAEDGRSQHWQTSWLAL